MTKRLGNSSLKQAAKCNFGDQLHVQLRDRVIAGISIRGLEREQLRMPNYSFQDARAACINYAEVNELDIQSMRISSTLPRRHDEIQFHPRNSCAFRTAKCFKCGKIVHIQSVCKIAVHFTSSSTKSLNLYSNNWAVPNNHLSLSTTSKGNAHIQKRLCTSLG
ncbi:unnamed protein product [Schistosoma curassoni]|uniref:CCHC-type domain-containing protein n=1 Tax=Schistosoma curassoni TaxID=6186 RepID=A0A183KR25_9TREM|nr:unnamed protein product [Schistosoma curassoni]